MPIPIVLALAVLTAGTAAVTYATLAPASVVREPDGARIEIARRFYESVDAMLQTGDSSDLERIVPPDFIDRVGPAGAGRDDLIRSIRDLRSRFPTARLTVDGLYGTTDGVVALLSVAGVDSDDILGIEASGGMATWAPVETLRIAGSQVLERRRVTPACVQAASFFAARLTPPPASASATDRAPVLSVRLDRVTIEPGAAISGAGVSAMLVYVEVGSVEATVDGEAVLFRAGERGLDGATVPSGKERLLAARDTLAVPVRAWHRLRATGSDPATVLIAKLGAAAFPEVIAADQLDRAVTAVDVASPGVAGITLVDVHPDVAAGTDPVFVECGRVTLAPGTFVTGIGTRSLTVVIVERGTLTAERGGLRQFFEAGTALIALSGDGAILRNTDTEPVSLLVLTV